MGFANLTLGHNKISGMKMGDQKWPSSFLWLDSNSKHYKLQLRLSFIMD